MAADKETVKKKTTKKNISTNNFHNIKKEEIKKDIVDDKKEEIKEVAKEKIETISSNEEKNINKMVDEPKEEKIVVEPKIIKKVDKTFGYLWNGQIIDY